MAELMRVQGALLLLQGAPGATTAAEGHFRQALDWAHRQGALSWELRAAMSLARLLRDRDRIGEARDLLAPIYQRFTEGFGTADLQCLNREHHPRLDPYQSAEAAARASTLFASPQLTGTHRATLSLARGGVI